MSKLHIAGDAPEVLKKQLLPLLARGTTTLSVAISEPGAGAHPKHLKTAARREGEHFIIDGEKAFLTNGPIADHFVVLAVAGETDGRKAFSAILVPADSDGFQRTAGVEIDFLHPSPHGGIALTACRVPVSNLIGEEGAAFERTSLRMRVFEDAVGAAAHVGAMACLLADIAALASSDMAGDIGVVATQLRALDVTAERLAAMVDHDDYQAIMELQLGFRLQSGHCMAALERLLQKSRGPYTSMTTLLARDIEKLHTIAQAAHTARTAKIGLALLKDQSGI
jgi:acyl-CoA dehydrogenase